MKIFLINPPHTAIGSRVPKEHLPPLGLLAIGGPLLDAGHDVVLLNADREALGPHDIVHRATDFAPDVVMLGHSGSSSAHPTAVQIFTLLKKALPRTVMVYGGVFPSYHWQEVLEACRAIDVIVRGEGEQAALALTAALQEGSPLCDVPGLAYRMRGAAKATKPQQMIVRLDDYRIGWELIDFKEYSYWGGKRAVVMQFSRGCPYLCTYCGQRGFWSKWRHRDPVLFAKEIARLVRDHGVELINLADENPTSSRRLWTAFLEALIAEDVEVLIVGSTRAGDIVRDADLLPLYKKAGVIRFLLGLEGVDQAVLDGVKKGSSGETDQQAIRLLRANGMIGLCTFAVGFEAERDVDYWRLMRRLLAYDPDQVMSVYATPHRWTPFYGASAGRMVIEPDLRRWDYKHQVLDCPHVPPWRVFAWVKAIEAVLQLRPKALWRTYLHPSPEIRHAMRWYSRMGRRVVLREALGFVFGLRFGRARAGRKTVAAFWGTDEILPEYAHSRSSPRQAGALPPKLERSRRAEARLLAPRQGS